MSAPVRVTPNPVDGVIEEIRVAMARRRWRQADLARQLGEPEHWVSRRLNRRVDLSVSELFRIADALGVEAHALLPDGQATVQEIHAYPWAPLRIPSRRSLLPADRRPIRLSDIAA